MDDFDYRRAWESAYTWEAYLRDEVQDHRALWHSMWERSAVPAELAMRAAALAGPRRLLAITEDWCGDASNTIPWVARMAAEAPALELRLVKRDANPALMDRFLTGGARSIPLIVVLDDSFRVVGRWGPRPAELQEWVLREKRESGRPPAEIYRDVRRWYARDRGVSTLREILEVVAR